MKSLVVVESPAKAKTIGKYLGRDYFVKASVGHIRDLPKNQLGVDLNNSFAISYVTIKEKVKVVDDLRKAAAKAKEVFLALDPDREGEAIAWHVSEILFSDGKKGGVKKSNLPKGKKTLPVVKQSIPPAKKVPVRRILFNEITRRAIQEAIRKPLPLDKNLFEAQQARRVLDRLVGYQVSPLLWEKVRRGLSAGRVQSVAVRLICEREREIRAFMPVEYWSLDVQLEGSHPPPFFARLTTCEGKKYLPATGEETERVIQEVRGGNWLLKEIVKKEKRRHAPPPFITSKLQQDAAQQLGFSAGRTMSVAQQLYEGVEIGEEGLIGLITYMRTDSVRISAEALGEVRSLVEEKYGKEYLPEEPNFYRSKKGAQDAHEAIRPTSSRYFPDEIREFLTPDQYKLYRLIWQRFVGSQMTSTVFDQTTFTIEAGRYGFRAVGSHLKFPGFKAVYTESLVDDGKKKEKEGEEEEIVEEGLALEQIALPDLKEGEMLKLLETKPEQHFTEPPPRFNEASLIKALEELGIGRPSTYAAIMANIVDREYIRKEQNRFLPSDLGFIVTDLLVESFPDIFNVEFTARMEEELDEVEEGRRSFVDTLNDFYRPFKEDLDRAKVEMKNVKIQETPTDQVCKKCGSPMVIKWGRRGEFLACSNYPECKSTHEFRRDEEGNINVVKQEVTGEFCASCGGQMLIKSGRFGRFLACSNYPNCKTTRPLSIGVDCPECHAPLSERRTKQGKTFYGCTRYPKCRFATWDRPLAEACPSCQSPYLIVRYRKNGEEVRCPRKECDFRKAPVAEAKVE